MAFEIIHNTNSIGAMDVPLVRVSPCGKRLLVNKAARALMRFYRSAYPSFDILYDEVRDIYGFKLYEDSRGQRRTPDGKSSINVGHPTLKKKSNWLFVIKKSEDPAVDFYLQPASNKLGGTK